MNYYAHSLEGYSPDRWQSIEAHLKNVAEKAGNFASSFAAKEFAYLAGLWHDLGKYSKEFQSQLIDQKTSKRHIDHSTAGAQHASIALGDFGKILAYVIAGHHAGLPNGKSNEISCLVSRLEKKIPIIDYIPDEILNHKIFLRLPFKLEKERAGFQISFFIRMIYSCLVDADFLDTEEFVNYEKSLWRKGSLALDKLNSKLISALQELIKNVQKTHLNKLRTDILKSCLEVADNPPGIFSLTVPTGGGKTLSSLAFAIKHAIKHNLCRIIYVIPYTSIIEQNAEVFKDILGNDAVLEHHCNFEPEEDDERSQLATENWDAPIIVTTNNQFFESLFSYKPSHCRKIHNIARSVVILDEAQMLPSNLLKPCIEVLRELASSYKTTVVLCTATQPALSTHEKFRNGLDHVKEIMSSPKILYSKLQRVEIKVLGKITNDDLVSRLEDFQQVLCIMSTRKQAQRIYRSLISKKTLDKQNECYHLSALMCPAHRSEKISMIKSALRSGKFCKVVTTPLIEAGVDIDFPVVFRSIGGIDSIAQAAGRCNREGLLSGKGKLFILIPEQGIPLAHFRETAEISQNVMSHYEDPLSLEAIEEYFRFLFWIKDERLDEYDILTDLEEDVRRGNFPFQEIAKKFKIIKNEMESIIVPWENHKSEIQELIDKIQFAEFPAKSLKKLQRFIVQLFPDEIKQLEIMGTIQRIKGWEHLYLLINEEIYRDDLGLHIENLTNYEVDNFIV